MGKHARWTVVGAVGGILLIALPLPPVAGLVFAATGVAAVFVWAWWKASG